jgi:hypothetical protein
VIHRFSAARLVNAALLARRFARHSSRKHWFCLRSRSARLVPVARTPDARVGFPLELRKAREAQLSHFVTDGVGKGRYQAGRSGNRAAENRYGITLLGNGRYRLESPSLGSTPGHPSFRKKSVPGRWHSPVVAARRWEPQLAVAERIIAWYFSTYPCELRSKG